MGVAGKLACTVLRREAAGNSRCLSDTTGLQTPKRPYRTIISFSSSRLRLSVKAWWAISHNLTESYSLIFYG